jgi:hypothetical protein
MKNGKTGTDVKYNHGGRRRNSGRKTRARLLGGRSEPSKQVSLYVTTDCHDWFIHLDAAAKQRTIAAVIRVFAEQQTSAAAMRTDATRDKPVWFRMPESIVDAFRNLPETVRNEVRFAAINLLLQRSIANVDG